MKLLLAAAALALTVTSAQAQIWWEWIEADNGAVYGIDMTSIEHLQDARSRAWLCISSERSCRTSDPSDPRAPGGMIRFLFDCRGHVAVAEVDYGPRWQVPRSVMGRIAELACVGVAP